MSDTSASLARKIGTAGDLQSVVRTMKAVAASSITQYENAVRALDDYYCTVQLGLMACVRQGQQPAALAKAPRQGDGALAAVVFGSDQGLVGQFNEAMADFVLKTLEDLPGAKTVCAVGERIGSRLAQTRLIQGRSFALPGSMAAITPLVGQVLVEVDALLAKGQITQVYVFHSRPHVGAIYTPVCQRLLPLDDAWRRELAAIPWPTRNLPEAINGAQAALPAFVREYLFVSLFRACAESLASENASRLAAMQRAEKNIEELLDELNRSFHRLRQGGIDEELFDLVAGFEALTEARPLPDA